EVVYAREGQPLVLPISAEIDDLRAEVDTTGRYRLDLVDQNNKPIEGASSGYVQINKDAQSAPAEAQAVSASRSSLTTASDNIILESMRMQSLIAVSVVEKFPQMVEAVATLLRAADGAGLPARPGMALVPSGEEDDEDEDDHDERPAAPGFDIGAMLGQMLPMLFGGLASGKIKMPDVGAMFDWRKATPKPKAEIPAATSTEKAAASTAPVTKLPPIDPAAMVHVVAIQSALQPSEVAYVQEVAKELSPAELRAWFDKLSKLSVPEAVETIRGLIAGNAKTGGAS
ncbi:MAG: hypothetical protein NT062_10950, partial [Proteobacteria bacterium]|nr:hypothetical protein [Pseudomonadota bacterium]